MVAFGRCGRFGQGKNGWKADIALGSSECHFRCMNDDLTGALGLVALIDLAVLVIGAGVLVWWHQRFQPSTSATVGAWAGFLGGYVVFLRWAFVPVPQTGWAILVAVVWGVVIGAAGRLVFWLLGFLVRRRPSE